MSINRVFSGSVSESRKAGSDSQSYPEIGKEATLGMLNEGDFFGEGGLAGQPLRMGSATAMTDCELMRIEKKAMMLALHQEHTLSDLFTAYLS